MQYWMHILVNICKTIRKSNCLKGHKKALNCTNIGKLRALGKRTIVPRAGIEPA